MPKVFQALDIIPKFIVVGGAHEGGTTLEYLNAFEPLKIDAYEPDLDNFHILKNNLHLYIQSGAVSVSQIALAAKSEKRELNRFSHNATHSFFSPGEMNLWDEPVRGIDSVLVDSKRMDEVYFNSVEAIDLLHLDTQGSELEILIGAKRLIESGKINVMRLEVEFEEIYYNQPLFFDIMKFLNPYFRLAAIADPKVRPGKIPKLVWADAIFINRNL